MEIVDDRPGKDAAYLLDSIKLREALSWSDLVSLDKGIEEVISWANSNLKILENEVDQYIHKP